MRDGVAADRSSGSAPQYLAPWYLAYLILGLINSGILPFLLPLAVARNGHDLDSIGYVVGAYNAGQLPAPLFGLLAERRWLFRPVFFGGFLVLAVGLAAIPAISALGLWVPLVVLCGLGVGAIATVAPLFVVDFAPKSEWNPRIGWLQSCNGAGQLIGLLLAGLIARGALACGFWLAAALSALAIVVGRIGLPADGRRRSIRLPRLDWGALMAGFQAGPPAGGLLQHSHHLQGAAWRRLLKPLGGGFGRFMLAWVAVNFGVAPFFAYYPLLMQANYGITPAATAFCYALAAAIGIAIFVLTGRFAQQYGARCAFRIGLAVRLAGFGILLVLTPMPPSRAPAAAALGFLLVMLAWPVLSVSATGLAASLTPFGEGAAMGFLAAGGAIATVLGSFLAGPLVMALGYQVIPLFAVAALSGAVLLIRKGRPASEEAHD